MLPICVSYDSGVDFFEEAAIRSGLFEALECLRYQNSVRIIGSDPWHQGKCSSADWYIGGAKTIYRDQIGQQIDADDLIRMLMCSPWQINEPHIDILFTSHDLTVRRDGDWLNFVFGASLGRVTVQSVARFRDIPNGDDRRLAIKTLMQHELGHIFGMAANPNRSNVRDSIGPHCTNYGCVMRQALTVPAWVENAREAYQMGTIYCPQCRKDMADWMTKQEIWGA